MKKRNLLLIFLIVFFVIAFAIGIVIMINGRKNNDDKDDGKAQINQLITSFYEGDYYVSTDFDEIVNLTNDGLTMRLSDLEEMTKKTLDIDCNKETSTITIYPKEPFEIKDYKVVYNLDCKK